MPGYGAGDPFIWGMAATAVRGAVLLQFAVPRAARPGSHRLSIPAWAALGGAPPVISDLGCRMRG